MPLIRILSALAIVVAATQPATAQENPIVARMAAFTQAFNAGDADAVAGFYTEDAALLPPQANARVGRGPIGEHYAASFGAGVGNLRFEVKDIRGHGPDSVVEIGETLVDLGEQTIHGRYLHVWVLQDQVWMLSRDIYHVLWTR